MIEIYDRNTFVTSSPLPYHQHRHNTFTTTLPNHHYNHNHPTSRYCASNEVLSRNGTSCRVCDVFMWPDPLTATYCNRIPATYYTWTSQTTVIVLCSSLIGMVVCLTTLAYFHINKKGTCVVTHVE